MRARHLTKAALGCSIGLLLGGCGGSEAPSRETSRAASAAPPAPRFPFVEVTGATGIDFVHDSGAAGRRHYVETMAPGLALFDADADGDLDLYVVDGGPLPGSPPAGPSGPPGNRLYLNRGDGTFEDAGAGAADTGYGMGVAIGDYDGDGDPDIYVLNYGPNAMYRNDGTGSFERVAVGAEDPSWSVSGVFFDYDGDLDLDLYVANYLTYDVAVETSCRAGTLEIYCSPEQYPPAADRLYRNDGGRFVEVSRAAGVAPDTRGMGIVAGDLDGDGDQDLYLTNDRSQNLMYLNDTGRLAEVAVESGVGYSETGMAEGGMGVVTGDFTGTGRPAIFFTNFQKEPNRLFVASEGMFFDDRSNMSGVGMPSRPLVGWGIATPDVEGDGDLDLVVGNGHVFDNAAEFIPGSAFALADHLYLNNGDGRFELEEFPGPPQSSRGIASGDLDGDGDPDLVIAACSGRLKVWRNETDRPERFLLVELVGAPPNSDAYGARLTARLGDRELRREVTSGGSYASQSDRRITLGLSDAGKADSIAVRWPDGSIEESPGADGGQLLVWRQGEGIVERRPLGGVAR